MGKEMQRTEPASEAEGSPVAQILTQITKFTYPALVALIICEPLRC